MVRPGKDRLIWMSRVRKTEAEKFGIRFFYVHPFEEVCLKWG